MAYLPATTGRWHWLLVLGYGLLTGAGCSSSRDDVASPAEVEALIAAGDFAGAEQQAKQRVLAAPDDPAPRLLLGRIYLAAEDGAAAFIAFDRARELGASDAEVRGGLAESLILQAEYAEALDLLATSAKRSEIPPPLLRLRLEARLRIPLTNPRDLFLDARHLLTAGTSIASKTLEDLAAEDGAIPENADHVRRAIAYWSCQQAPSSANPADTLYRPAWANLDETGRRVLAVGPELELKAPSAAARIARDGDIVEIQAGTYRGDVAVWEANDLWLRSTGGMAILDSGGATALNMGIWVIQGDNTIVEGIRFEGARSTRKNGSGVRLHARNLWVRHAEFHDNEAGLLTYNQPGGEVIVEHSIFTANGAGDGYSHNVYIGRTNRLIFRFNFSTGVRVGNLLKSRALENYILYNRLSDGPRGNSSYTIDLSEGGFAFVMGNELIQGTHTVNRHMVSLGAEKPQGRDHRFIFAYNIFYNRTAPATFIRDATHSGVELINNIFAGAPANLDTATPLREGNVFNATGLRDTSLNDFRLIPSTPFIDSGIPVPTLDDISIVPRYEYVHPAGAKPRKTIWRPDPGAHEFCGWPEYAAS